MTDVTVRLGLPLLLPAQSQKHVTHNEALDRVDMLVQAVVEGLDLVQPPVPAVEGPVWATGAAPQGAWSGYPRHLASLRGGGWVFVPLAAGWRVWVRPLGAARVFDGSAWLAETAAADLQNLPWIGVNATADVTNRLSVAAPAALFSHAGAGHQVKVNKASAGDTASLMFQTGFSGRAEIGLTGGDDLALRVSADGTGWTTSLTAERSSGRVALPAGVQVGAGNAAAPGLQFPGDGDTGLFHAGADQIGFSAGGTRRVLVGPAAMTVDVPLGGTAVVQGTADTTAGRLLTTGWMGLGASAPTLQADLNSVLRGQFAAADGTAANLPAAGGNWGVLALPMSASELGQIAIHDGGDIFVRVRADGTGWGPWNTLFGQRNTVGPVSQSGGLPTGRVIERGSNANGDYLRLADGTQVCWGTLSLTAVAVTTAFAGGFRSGTTTSATFSAAFSATPRVVGQVADVATCDALVIGSSASPSGVQFRFWRTVSGTVNCNAGYMAVGRWF